MSQKISNPKLKQLFFYTLIKKLFISLILQPKPNLIHPHILYYITQITSPPQKYRNERLSGPLIRIWKYAYFYPCNTFFVVISNDKREGKSAEIQPSRTNNTVIIYQIHSVARICSNVKWEKKLCTKSPHPDYKIYLTVNTYSGFL